MFFLKVDMWCAPGIAAVTPFKSWSRKVERGRGYRIFPKRTIAPEQSRSCPDSRLARRESGQDRDCSGAMVRFGKIRYPRPLSTFLDHDLNGVTAAIPGAHHMSTFKKNILANLVGKTWSGLVWLVFLPVYLKFMGVEAYGLVGFYLSLTAVLVILDLGLSTTINRELARLSVQKDKRETMGNLLRSGER